MKKYRFHGLAVLLILLLSAVFAYTHSGRTDKNGGHYNRKTGEYHYHNAGKVPRTIGTLPRAPDVKTGEWEKPYLPTQIEWLTLQLNANYSYPLFAESGEYVARFSFWNRKDNVVEITVHYASRVESQKDKLMAHAKKIVVALAEAYGWENWIKIEGKFKKI